MTSALINLAATATILSKAEHSELCAFYQSDQCSADIRDAALQRLIESNIRLAHKVAKRHHRNNITHEDLLSCAVEGIITAAGKFDASKEASFTTYARLWMTAKCQEHVQANSGMVHCGSRTSKALWSGLQKARKVIGVDATPEQLAEHMDLPLADVRACLQYMTDRGVSLDAPLNESGGTVATLISNGQQGQDVRMDRARSAARIRAACQAFIKTLSARDASIMSGRILHDVLGTERKSAMAFGVTKQRVGQIERTLSAKLAAHLSRQFGADNVKTMMGL